MGTLYSNMMKHIKDAFDALDTSKYTIHMGGFVWLQGEFDAMNNSQADAYETNLTNLIKDIRDTLNAEDLPVILPMIDAQSIWSQHAKVRAADIAVRNKLENVDTLDTKGFETDGIHYKAPGVIKIGRIAAERWLAMDYFVPVPVIPVSRNTMRPVVMSAKDLSFIDCAGRKIKIHRNDISDNRINTSSGFMLVVKNGTVFQKKLNLTR
ncbi:MAG: sialate O-acetylesterase [Fibrobacter sp.]|nr:sialate O-acetylesterase [Fibrobacter sp.]